MIRVKEQKVAKVYVFTVLQSQASIHERNVSIWKNPNFNFGGKIFTVLNEFYNSIAVY